MHHKLPALAASILAGICFLTGGGLVAQDGNNAADQKTAAASPAPAGASILLALELSDGSRVIGTPAVDRLKLTTQYADFEILLSKLLTIEFSGADHAAHVSLENGDLLNGKLDATEIALKTTFGPVVIPMALVGKIRVLQSGEAFVNSLGMRFMYVPGTNALFSVWDTRVRDYRAFGEAHPGADGSWKYPDFKQTEDDPVVNVSWGDAKAFCAWLTQKERDEGTIAQNKEYRLPTDKEWSVAAGAGKYPWGNDWPPPKGAGNYDPSLKVDDFKNTSPVGSFKANQYGLYDMGGNVWQWCEDWYDPAQTAHDIRGGSLADSLPARLLSSSDARSSPDNRTGILGFRCVLAPVEVSR